MFLEVVYPESGFFECMERKTNPADTIIMLSNVIIRIFDVPFSENIKCLCERVLQEETFWNQYEKLLKESTSPPAKSGKPKSKKKLQLPKNDQELWQSFTHLCTAFDTRKIRLPKSFLKKAVHFIETNKNAELKLDEFAETLKRLQQKDAVDADQQDRKELYPSLDELKNANEELLSPNIVKGRYSDVSHYLDVHLALLREDFISPLRDGIKQIISKGSDGIDAHSNANIKVYPGVKILIKEKEYANKNGISTKSECIMVDLEAKARAENGELGQFSQNKYAKKLMYGSLLCFTTSSCFDDLIVAIVSNRDVDMLNQGFVRPIFFLSSLFLNRNTE